MLRCTPGSTASLGSCLYPGLPPDQLLEMLRDCSGGTVFSMMQAVCPPGWGYRWLAGPAVFPPIATCCFQADPTPVPVPTTSSARVWGGGLAGGKVPPDASPLFHRMLAWEGFDVRVDFNSVTYWQCGLGASYSASVSL